MLPGRVLAASHQLSTGAQVSLATQQWVLLFHSFQLLLSQRPDMLVATFQKTGVFVHSCNKAPSLKDTHPQVQGVQPEVRTPVIPRPARMERVGLIVKGISPPQLQIACMTTDQSPLELNTADHLAVGTICSGRPPDRMLFLVEETRSEVNSCFKQSSPILRSLPSCIPIQLSTTVRDWRAAICAPCSAELMCAGTAPQPK
jgi:hypothetical protein